MSVGKEYMLNCNVNDFKKGDIVEIFTGYTYGCIKDGNIAVKLVDTCGIKPKNASNFVEVSLDFLDEYNREEDSRVLKCKICRYLGLLLRNLCIKN